MTIPKNPVYYEPQEDFTAREFYYIHRVLHRRFFYDKKYVNEIAAMDTSRMTEKTKVIIHCIIDYYHKEYLYDQHPNLRPIAEVAPLAEPLYLDDPPLLHEPAYEKMNVFY